MGHAVANITLNLYCDGLQEVGEAQHLEVVLTKDEIIYHEKGHVVRDVGSSTSIPDLCMSWDDFGVDPYMGIIGSSSSCRVVV